MDYFYLTLYRDLLSFLKSEVSIAIALKEATRMFSFCVQEEAECFERLFSFLCAT